MKNNLVIMIVIALVVGGGAFYGGMQYQKSQRSGFARQINAGAGGFGARNGQAGSGNRPVYGDIISSDDKSVTVKLADGSSKIVLLASTTSINKAALATAADLKVGEKVSVFGQTNTDGSVTAQNIQLNPIMRINPTGGNNPPR
jgi:hypothetical protein